MGSIVGVSSVVGASLLGKQQEANAQEYFPGRPDRLGMLSDLTLCVGCRSCEEACVTVDKLPPLGRQKRFQQKAKTYR